MFGSAVFIFLSVLLGKENGSTFFCTLSHQITQFLSLSLSPSLSPKTRFTHWSGGFFCVHVCFGHPDTHPDHFRPSFIIATCICTVAAVSAGRCALGHAACISHTEIHTQTDTHTHTFCYLSKFPLELKRSDLCDYNAKLEESASNFSSLTTNTFNTIQQTRMKQL